MPAETRFDARFREQFKELLEWRRDVRRFLPDPLPPGLLEEILALSQLAPSVGLSEPWRYVLINDPKRRAAIRENFETANRHALSGYSGERATLYANLKLAGLDSAPVHLAAFADCETTKGSGLGRRTMPQMQEYSIVAAITTLWLAARAFGVGLGWVSILDPGPMNQTLAVPGHWRLVAYLCLGYPQENSTTPALEQAGWEKRLPDVPLLER